MLTTRNIHSICYHFSFLQFFSFSYDDIATCSQTEGDCDTTPSVTSAPTPAGAVTTIDCSYDACTLPLTSTDCTSLTNQCAANGGVAFCVPGDNEFECNNIAYTGAGACTDGTATSQCVGYDYTGYTCTDNEGDCDDPALATFAPTPAADRTVPMIDCDYEECTTVLTSDDCSEISASCSALGGVSFCAVGSSEFECNNIPWGGSQGCTDELAEATCLTYSFPSAGECLDKDGDCSSTSTSGDDGDDELSDGELAAIAILVPILLVMVGCAVWYVLSKRAAENDKPPMASQERESTSSAL